MIHNKCKNVIKRDGRKKTFDIERIKNAIMKAYNDVSDIDTFKEQYCFLQPMIERKLINEEYTVEEIQDIIIDSLSKVNENVSKSYKAYREIRNNERVKRSVKERFYNEVLECTNVDNDNANVDQYSFSGRKYRITDYEQKLYALRNLISDKGKQAFEEGLIYYHDLASYAVGEFNCMNLDIKAGLSQGFTTRNGDVRPANSFSTACQLVAVMFQCQSQVQYGGVGANCFDFSLEKYVKKSFKKHFIDGLIWLEGKSKDESKELLGNWLMSIEDIRYKEISKKAYEFAMSMLEKEGRQSCEGLFHNLNTLESRAGSQLPFTSINLGRNITPEGKLINKWIFNASIKGIGKNHRTSIFPISIFQYKKGVNAKKEDPNYDIKQLAIQSLTKRIYPNIVNGDYKQIVENPKDPNTFFATMGCVDGQEVITYKINNQLYVESFERMWDRLSELFEIKEQNIKGNYYIDLSNITIFDTQNGFVECKRIIKNADKGDWHRITLSNGRILLATSDHPLPILSKGRTLLKNLVIGDKVKVSYNHYSQNESSKSTSVAWLLGVMTCDVDKYYFKKEHRKYNHIPTEVFSWDKEAKLSFIAGMIDSNGYINENMDKGNIVVLEYKNKEISLQTMALIQSCGYPAHVYLKNYSRKEPYGIKYKVEFPTFKELLQYMVSANKKEKFTNDYEVSTSEYGEITKIEFLGNRNEYSYDVTTESDYFEVSGIYSHNCRTMLGYDRFLGEYRMSGRGNISPITVILPKLGLDYGIALSKRDKADIEGFFVALEDTLELVGEELFIRTNYIGSQSPKSAPFIYNNNMVLDSDKSKDKNNVMETIKHGTNAIGLIGMAECCIAMFNKHHGESVEAYEFAMRVVRLFKKKANEFSDRYNLNYSVYYTPAENLCKTACKTLQLYYGKVKGVTDKKYLTNSIHIPVYYQLDAYTKIALEAPFTQYGTGGCITYVELDNSSLNNPEAIEKLIDYAMDLNIPYLAINFPINTCLECGTTYNEDREVCPNCQSPNVEMLKRVTGYITGNYKTAFNEGKQQEAEERVVHNIFNPTTVPVLKQAYKELKDLGILEDYEI